VGAEVEIVGLPHLKNAAGSQLQWVVPGMQKEELIENAFLIAPSVQDIINLRSQGCRQPTVAIPITESLGEQSAEPFVVKRENQTASLQVWIALQEGRPVIYPQESAYYEQVFHAGLSYRAGEDPDQIAEQGREMATELRALRFIPSSRATRGLLQALLLISRRTQ